MEIEIVRPEEIEKRSFAIISEELKAQGITLPEDQEAVTKRCIHTSADFDYARNLVFSEGAVEKAKEAIRRKHRKKLAAMEKAGTAAMRC